MHRTEKLEPGSTFGDFVVGALLGSGGFGTVYRAKGKDDGLEVALKISHPTTGRLSTQQIVRQQNEIEALARLSHRSLVKVHRYGFTADGRFFLAMELVEGVRLDQFLIERRRLDVIEAIQVVRKVAETVAYCHAQGVLHLDLKPENIMVTEPHEPRLKVLDFGLAHLRGEAGPGLAGPARGGTVPYMAPEYFDPGGTLAPDPKLDLYAIGTILYELLSGELTYDASSVGQLAHFKRFTDPRPIRERVPSVPEPVATLVHALLAREPGARFGSAAALATRLKELYYATLAGAPASASDRSQAAGPATCFAPDDAPFVGRAEELAMLAGELAAIGSAAAEGGGRAVLVVGDAGLGKSRLVAESVRRSAGPGTVVLYGRCRQLGEIVPYSPLREALGQLAHLVQHDSKWAAVDGAPSSARATPASDVPQRARDGRAERLRTTLRPALAAEALVLSSLVPELYESDASASDAGAATDLAAFRLAGADRVARALGALLAAAATPIALVLEDLHWADEGTLAVLSRLLHGGLPGHVLLIATSRSFEALPSAPGLRVSPLPLLAPAENEALLAALTGGHDGELTTALKHSIPLLGAGNPLFNTQVVRNLEVEGYLRRSADGRVVLGERGLGGYEPPGSVSSVLSRSLRRLPPPVQEVLAAAALMGRQLSVTDLRELGLFDAAAVDEALRASQEQGLCRITGDLCWFVHDTIREHLQATVPALRLPEIHGRIARQLQRRGAPAGTMGRHLEEAGELRAAAEAFYEAGRASDRLHDPSGARRHLEHAFRLLATLPPSDERAIMLARTTYELVRVGCALGDTAETLRYVDDCAGRVKHGSPEVTAALDSSYARLAYVQGNLPLVFEHGTRCLATVTDTPALGAYQCFPANVVGRARCISGRFAEALPLLERGCALARELGEYSELSHSAGLLAVCHAFHGDHQAAERFSRVCVDYARRLRDPVRIIAALVYRTALAEARFDWDQGVKDSTELLALAEEHGIGGLYLYVGTTMTGRHQFHVGNLGRARVLLANALNLSTVFKMASVRSWANAYLGDVHLVSGDKEAARAQYLQGLESARSQNGDELSEPMCLVGLAQIEALTARDTQRIRDLGDEAVARLSAAGNRMTRVAVLQRYAEALELAGDTAGAAGRYAERAGLLADVAGVVDPEFWPRIPVELAAGGGTPASRREYWRLYAQALVDHPARRPANRTTFVTLPTLLANEPSGPAADPPDLLESLATIDGYMPPF